MSRAEDHALGLELQLIELVEQQTRARLQHREADVNAAQQEIDALQEELARTEEGSSQGPMRPAFRRAAQAGGRPAG
jgi:DNA-binding protein H-NS